MSTVALGPGRRALRTVGLSTILNVRLVWLVAICAAVCLVALVLASANGEVQLSLPEVWQAVTGQASEFTTRVVVEWRLPRAVASIVFGAALAIGGALVQSLTRNPLGSPDIIGLNAGAYTGALIAITTLGGSTVAITGSAFIGAVATAALVWGLASGRGQAGDRFVMIGVGVAAALTAINSMIVLRASTRVAMRATIWGQGSLAEVRWSEVLPAVVIVLVLIPSAAWATSGMRPLELGDDLTAGLGRRPGRIRMAMLLVAVLLTAVVTGVSGPIMFLALVAPHLARFLTRSAGTTWVGSAAVGAALLSVCDLIAQFAFPEPIPVGIVTVVAGGAYLIVLLAQRLRKG